MKINFSKSHSAKALVNYLLRDQPARLLWSNLAARTPEAIGRYFSAHASLIPRSKYQLIHFAMSATEGERLSDEKWKEAATILMRKLDISTARPFLLVAHRENHVHLALGYQGFDGRLWKDSHSVLRSISASQGIEVELNLVKTVGLSSRPLRKKTMREGYPHKKGSVSRLKRELFDAVVTAREASDNFADFLLTLEKKGVHFEIVNHFDGVGLKFRAGMQWYSAYQISQQFAYGQLINYFTEKQIRLKNETPTRTISPKPSQIQQLPAFAAPDRRPADRTRRDQGKLRSSQKDMESAPLPSPLEREHKPQTVHPRSHTSGSSQYGSLPDAPAKEGKTDASEADSGLKGLRSPNDFGRAFGDGKHPPPRTSVSGDKRTHSISTGRIGESLMLTDFDVNNLIGAPITLNFDPNLDIGFPDCDSSVIYDFSLGQVVRWPYEGCMEIPISRSEKKCSTRIKTISERAHEIVLRSIFPEMGILKASFPFLKLMRAGLCLVWRANGKTKRSDWCPEDKLRQKELLWRLEADNEAMRHKFISDPEWMVERTRRLLARSVKSRDRRLLMEELHDGQQYLRRPEVVVRCVSEPGQNEAIIARFQLIYPELCSVQEVILDTMSSLGQIHSLVGKLHSPVIERVRANVSRDVLLR